jgi:ribosome-associated toxin RatA of RatAB toxin-antitoxin module
MRAPALALLAVGLAAPAQAGAPLQPFPPAKLRSLAPLLVQGEMAAIESGPDGRPRQITLLAWTAAPPEVALDVVGHPERYPQFVRNLSKSEITPRPDGSVDNTWQLELPIGHFTGSFNVRTDAAHRMVAFQSLTQDSTSLWEFLPADGGGTVIVEYMRYAAPRQNLLLRKLLEKDPANETGMGLAAGLVLMKSVAAESARRAHASQLKVKPPPAGAPGFGFLLDRGAVAIIRSLPNGSLADVSVVKRIDAPIARVLEVVRDMERWPEFMPAVSSCKRIDAKGDELTYQLTVDGILLSIDTRYRAKLLAGGVDLLGVGGDLVGSRFRWDLTAQGEHTLAVYRANHRVGASSVILRALIKHEPLFEHGVNVGVGIIAVDAVARRAAQPVGRLP